MRLKRVVFLSRSTTHLPSKYPRLVIAGRRFSCVDGRQRAGVDPARAGVRTRGWDSGQRASCPIDATLRRFSRRFGANQLSAGASVPRGRSVCVRRASQSGRRRTPPPLDIALAVSQTLPTASQYAHTPSSILNLRAYIFKYKVGKSGRGLLWM